MSQNFILPETPAWHFVVHSVLTVAVLIPAEGLRDRFVIGNMASVEQLMTQQSHHPGQASDGSEPGPHVMKYTHFFFSVFFLPQNYPHQAHSSNI